MLQRLALLLSLSAPLAMGFAGCDDDSPIEEAGDRIEDAVEDDSPVEEVGESVEEATDEVGE